MSPLFSEFGKAEKMRYDSCFADVTLEPLPLARGLDDGQMMWKATLKATDSLAVLQGAE